MRSHALVLLFLWAALAVLSSGCRKSTTSQAPPEVPMVETGGNPPEAPVAGRKYRIAFSQCNGAEPWRVLFDKEIKAEAERHGDTVELLYADAQNDSARQIAQMENFIVQKVDAILISPKESAPLTPVVEKAYDAGIPVIVLDRGVNTEKFTCFIGGDNLAIGREAGKYAVKILGGKGKVVELWGLKGSTPAQERHQGFHEAIRGTNIQVIVEQEGKWLQPNARALMENILKTQPEIDLVYAHNDPMARGAYLAALDAGRAGQIKFLGVDGNPGKEGGCQDVLDGKLSATFLYPRPGVEGLRTALKVLQGEKVPKRITLPTVVIDASNAAQFVAAP
ncbi:MAG: substrate-binding domain-containing protein [Armatimonadota bacterium]|nr:substrate-binding domain-containing protein [Armatimonadota bacterium]